MYIVFFFLLYRTLNCSYIFKTMFPFCFCLIGPFRRVYTNVSSCYVLYTLMFTYDTLMKYLFTFIYLLVINWHMYKISEVNCISSLKICYKMFIYLPFLFSFQYCSAHILISTINGKMNLNVIQR